MDTPENDKEDLQNTPTEPTAKQLAWRWLAAVIIVAGIGTIIKFEPSTGLVGEFMATFSPQYAQTTVTAPSSGPGSASRADTSESDPEPEPEINQLQALIDEFAFGQPAQFYIYAKNLKTGETATIKPHEPIPSGSIYKIFLANQVYKLNEAGKLNILSPAGYGDYSLHTCTMLMVRDSLNACGEAVRITLGAAKTTKELRKAGYKDTNVAKAPAAVTSAHDVALLLERLYEGGYFNKAHTAEFMGYLRDQMWTFRLPEGLPRQPVIAGKAGWRNKTGDVYAYANDGVIILGENTDYILVVLSGPWAKVFPDSSYAIRHLSGLVYNHMNGTEHELIY